MKENKQLEFYNTVIKSMRKNNKEFHFEIPQSYFDKDKASDFLKNCYEYHHSNDGYNETLSIRYSPIVSEYMQFNMNANTKKVISNEEFAYDFLVRMNKYEPISFPSYFWAILFDFAEVKEGKFENKVSCFYE